MVFIETRSSFYLETNNRRNGVRTQHIAKIMTTVVTVRFHQEVLQLKLERKGFKDKAKTQRRWAVVLVRKAGKVVRKGMCTSQEKRVLQDFLAAAADLPHLKGRRLDPFSETSSVQKSLKAIWAKQLRGLATRRAAERATARAQKAAQKPCGRPQQQAEAAKKARGADAVGMRKIAAFGAGWKGDLSRIGKVQGFAPPPCPFLPLSSCRPPPLLSPLACVLSRTPLRWCERRRWRRRACHPAHVRGSPPLRARPWQPLTFPPYTSPMASGHCKLHPLQPCTNWLTPPRLLPWLSACV